MRFLKACSHEPAKRAHVSLQGVAYKATLQMRLPVIADMLVIFTRTCFEKKKNKMEKSGNQGWLRKRRNCSLMSTFRGVQFK